MQIPVKINGLYKIRISADTIQRFQFRGRIISVPAESMQRFIPALNMTFEVVQDRLPP